MQHRSTCFRPLRFSRGLSRPENAFSGHKEACCEVSIETSKVSGTKTLAPAMQQTTFDTSQAGPVVGITMENPD